MSTQGARQASPGQRPGNRFLAEFAALKGRASPNVMWSRAPLQGLNCMERSGPRALPWAGLVRTFGDQCGLVETRSHCSASMACSGLSAPFAFFAHLALPFSSNAVTVAPAYSLSSLSPSTSLPPLLERNSMRRLLSSLSLHSLVRWRRRSLCPLARNCRGVLFVFFAPFNFFDPFARRELDAPFALFALFGPLVSPLPLPAGTELPRRTLCLLCTLQLHCRLRCRRLSPETRESRVSDLNSGDSNRRQTDYQPGRFREPVTLPSPAR